MAQRGLGMLRGHQSLQNLVGKRSRLLASHPVASALPDADGAKVLALEAAAGVGDLVEVAGGGCSSAVIDILPSGRECTQLDSNVDDLQARADDRVECPICLRRIPSAPDAVNAHLDKCLAGGQKKTKQLTLAQTCSRSQGQGQPVKKKQRLLSRPPPSPPSPSSSHGPPALFMVPPIPRSSSHSSSRGSMGELLHPARWQAQAAAAAAAPERDGIPLSLRPDGEQAAAVGGACTCACHASTSTSTSTVTSSSSCGPPEALEGTPESGSGSYTSSCISSICSSTEGGAEEEWETVHTHVVGSRFVAQQQRHHRQQQQQEEEQEEGEEEGARRVRGVREPENPRDSHAIQVVLEGDGEGEGDAGGMVVLGWLPRGVARCLAPLLDCSLLSSLKGVIQPHRVAAAAAPGADANADAAGAADADANAALAAAAAAAGETAAAASGRLPLEVELQCGHAPLEGLSPQDALRLHTALADARQAAAAAASAGGGGGGAAARGRQYRANFLYMLRSVLQHNAHLFDACEAAFLGEYERLADDTQELFVRLFQRKGPWFRVQQLAYWDAPQLATAVTQLLDAGYLSSSSSSSCDALGAQAPAQAQAQAEGEAEAAGAAEAVVGGLLSTLCVAELRVLLHQLHVKTRSEAGAMRKDELLAAALTALSAASREGQRVWAEEVAAITGPCVQVSRRAAVLVHRLQRVLFLNEEQGLGAFLLADMGATKYARYAVRRTGPVFASRAALLAFEQAVEAGQRMDEAVERGATGKALGLLHLACSALRASSAGTALPEGANWQFLARFRAEWIYTAMATLGVSLLEREHRYEEAVAILRELLRAPWCVSRRGHWYTRLALDLSHLGRTDDSLVTAELGVADPWVRAGDLVALQLRVVRLSKPPRRWRPPPYAHSLKWKCCETRVLGRPLNREVGAKSRFYGYDSQQCSVEELALQHYAASPPGWEGAHTEGGVWHTLFGLLLWDALFAPVPDVFQTPFQTAPLDLRTDAFYTARRELIERQLELMEQPGMAPQLLGASWREHRGTWCAGVNWERFSLEQLQTIAACIGGPSLAAVCRLLAQDYAGWSGGMPDLLLWRITETPRARCSDCACPLSPAASWQGYLGGTHVTVPNGTAACEKEQGRCELRTEPGPIGLVKGVRVVVNTVCCTTSAPIEGLEGDSASPESASISSGCEVLAAEISGGQIVDRELPKSVLRASNNCSPHSGRQLQVFDEQVRGANYWQNVRGEAKLVEVKGPRDRPSEQQRSWFAALASAGINVEVCKVVECERDLRLKHAETSLQVQS